MDYLSNPLQTGVYYSQLLVGFSELDKLIKDVVGKSKRTEEAKELTKFADEYKKSPYYDSDLLQRNFTKAVELLARSEDCPKEIIPYLFGKKGRPRALLSHVDEFAFSISRNKRIRVRRYPWAILNIFGSRILRDINDVIIIETEDAHKQLELSFEVTSITEEGTKRFKDFLKCIPHIGDKVKEIRSRKTFSSRYTFRPYPLAVRLWLESEEAVTVTEDLRDFLKGSMRYHSEEEWRTSIVLSAIAVESVLADLYEEKHKTYAPNVPLGDLYSKVKDKVTFPSEVKKAIEMVNEARISAVHRSRLPVSDREATNALYGSTTFIMWYSSNY